MFIPIEIKALAYKIKLAGGTLFVVGGAVRDRHMGIEPTDFDLLIVGLDQVDALDVMGNPEQVIGNAPVFVWRGYEVALARREVSTGNGKHGFEFIADTAVTINEDLMRRDFRLNSMAFDIVDDFVVDPFDGLGDIQDEILDPTSFAFRESPERVLRGMAFAGRFDFDVSDEFVRHAHAMHDDFHLIPKEQVWRHWWKGLTKSIKPSRMLDVLQVTGWITHWPELHALVECEQDPIWHPETFVFEHTRFVVDECTDPVVRLAGLCHDMGKPACNAITNGRITSHGHDKHIDPTIKFLDSIGCFEVKIREQVISLVLEHMAHLNPPTRRNVRRLSQRIQPATIEMLAELVTADVSGRPPLPKHTPANMLAILDIASDENLTHNPIQGIVMGRHLIDLGLKPSKQFGVILEQCLNAQIDGIFDDLDGGLEFFINEVKNER